jgi:hypothetical protein
VRLLILAILLGAAMIAGSIVYANAQGTTVNIERSEPRTPAGNSKLCKSCPASDRLCKSC